MKSEYRKSISKDYSQNKSTKIRWLKTLKFIKKDIEVKSALDIGDRTEMTDMLEKFYNVQFENTNIDLDTELLEGKFDFISCFEVIEHLYNPLHCLSQIHQVLQPNGILYLSTPLGKPNFLWADTHFHEMNKTSLLSLIKRSGLKVKRYKLVHTRPYSFYISGFKPLLRSLFDRTQILELIPNNK